MTEINPLKSIKSTGPSLGCGGCSKNRCWGRGSWKTFTAVWKPGKLISSKIHDSRQFVPYALCDLFWTPPGTVFLWWRVFTLPQLRSNSFLYGAIKIPLYSRHIPSMTGTFDRSSLLGQTIGMALGNSCVFNKYSNVPTEEQSMFMW